ncbi:MAG: PIG-L family deacetylase [Methylococcaceae bacterium]
MFTVVATVLLLQSSISHSEKKSEADERVILAVFAHPDDEASVSPVLVKYARQGVSVYLATVTEGRLGINEYTGILAGDSLAAVRKKGLICAAEKLGIKPHIMLGLHDQLKMDEGMDKLSE